MAHRIGDRPRLRGLNQRGKNRVREHSQLEITGNRGDESLLFTCRDPGCEWMGWLDPGHDVEVLDGDR